MQRQRFKNELHLFSVKNVLPLQMQRQLIKIIYVHLYLEYFCTENAAPTTHSYLEYFGTANAALT